MNINFIASRALTPVYPIIQVSVYTFLGQVNTLGTVVTSYNAPITVDANVQFSRPERLIHIQGYNETYIYRDFWINLEQLVGLNRNISTGGDYLVFEGLKYKIVGVDEKFRVGWVLLTCAQGELTDE
jgi:hypothetical protein